MTSLSKSLSEHLYKPSFASYKKYLAGALAASSFFVVALLIGVNHRSGAVIALIILLVGIAIGLGYVFLYIKMSRIVITDSEVRYRGLLKTTILKRDGLHSILVNYGASNPPLVTLMLADSSYAKKFRLNGGLWAEADQKEILELLQGENLLPQSVLTAQKLYETHPQFVRAFERGHGLPPAVSAGIIVVSTLLIIGVIIFIGVIVNAR